MKQVILILAMTIFSTLAFGGEQSDKEEGMISFKSVIDRAVAGGLIGAGMLGYQKALRYEDIKLNTLSNLPRDVSKNGRVSRSSKLKRAILNTSHLRTVNENKKVDELFKKYKKTASKRILHIALGGTLITFGGFKLSKADEMGQSMTEVSLNENTNIKEGISFEKASAGN